MSKRPAGQGKPKGAEPTPIETAYRTVRDVQDKGLVLTKENVEGVAETIRQAAIYDATHREREADLGAEIRSLRSMLMLTVDERNESYARARLWEHRAKLWALFGVVGCAAVALGAYL